MLLPRAVCPTCISTGALHVNPGEIVAIKPFFSLFDPIVNKQRGHIGASLGHTATPPTPAVRPPLVSVSKTASLAPSTVDILGWVFLGRGDCHVHCRMLSRVPGLYPLDVSSMSLVVTNPSLDIAKGP